MNIRDEFFVALNNWQKGWYEIQADKDKLAIPLKNECQLLDPKYRTVEVTCYRKRFLHEGEFVDIILKDKKDEGLASWTTDASIAEGFKGIYKEGGRAAVFEHYPVGTEIIVNLEKLWECDDFISAFNNFKARYPSDSVAIDYYKTDQKEIILEVPLRASELCRIAGESSSYDDICDKAGIPEEHRDSEYKRLVTQGVRIQEIMLLGKKATQNVLKHIKEEFYRRHADKFKK